MRTAKGVALGLLVLSAGCATVPTGPRVTVSALPVPPRALVLVLDGAGGTDITGRTLEDVVREQHLPLGVVPYDWSHGPGRIVADQWDVEHLDRQAEEFARFVRTLRAENPSLPLYVLTYSAGSAIPTRAARLLPPNTFERVVFLAPAVSAGTDLRPLLMVSRRGVDAFISDRDVFFLGIGATLIGTTGGPRGPAAGRVGFDPVICSQADAVLYSTKLRHYPWTPDYIWTGNVGQHAGGHQPKFLTTFVVPMFATP
jgi:hypothetical protein